MQGSDGNFYLTLDVVSWSARSNRRRFGLQPGAIVQVSPAGEFQMIHTLAADGSEGDTPSGPLVEDSTGALYGMTASSYNNYLQTAAGVAFKVTTAGQYTILHSFTGGADGMVDTGSFHPCPHFGKRRKSLRHNHCGRQYHVGRIAPRLDAGRCSN